MRLFVTGASGWIGSAVVPELLGAGHEVLGLARSDTAAATITALGAEVHRGALADLDSLRAGAAASDGVIHLGYVHDFSQMAEAARTDLAAVQAMGEVLEGSDRPLLIASGIGRLSPGRVATELDAPDASTHPRIATADTAIAFASRGVRSIVARFAPTVHGAGDHGFVARLVAIARERGVSGYVGDGSNRWAAVHRLDAGALVRIAIEDAVPASIVHATAEEGVSAREIAEAIGRGLDLPVESVAVDDAAEHFGWLGQFFGADLAASSTVTQERLGWKPTHPTLIEDLDAGHYFA